jgi:hypothetical protein
MNDDYSVIALREFGGEVGRVRKKLVGAGRKKT